VQRAKTEQAGHSGLNETKIGYKIQKLSMCRLSYTPLPNEQSAKYKCYLVVTIVEFLL